MDEAGDDILSRPLGQAAAAPRRRLAMPRASAARVAGTGAAAAALLVAAILLTGDPRGGEPRAEVAIDLRAPTPPAPSQAGGETPGAAPRASAAQSAQAVEQASGVTVYRPGGTAAPDAPVLIQVPSGAAAANAFVTLAPAPDPRLTERGRHGLLPRSGEGRLRALDVYARPDAPVPGMARIAILVSGLGVGQAATAAAITRLPPAVSLALTPYGTDLEKTAMRARDAGHEILLQVPMEPFDYPDSDPGPQSLLTSLRPPENLDRLAWAMSRFPGAVGVVNFMGAKLAGDPAAFEPVLREIGARGLGYVDDGTAQRAVASGLAAKTTTPVARAEIVIDAVPRPDLIDRELARLETQARKNGFALASASALPLTIDRIARWSADLATRGVRLVPVSVALRGPGPGTRVSSAAP